MYNSVGSRRGEEEGTRRRNTHIFYSDKAPIKIVEHLVREFCAELRLFGTLSLRLRPRCRRLARRQKRNFSLILTSVKPQNSKDCDVWKNKINANSETLKLNPPVSRLN